MLKIHFVCELVSGGDIEVLKIHTVEKPAYMRTKVTSEQVQAVLRLLGISEPASACT